MREVPADEIADQLAIHGFVQRELDGAFRCVEAVELGLGAVWMGVAPEVDLVAAVVEVLDVPVGLEPFAIIACGIPADEPTPKGKDRFDEQRIHWVS